METLTAEERQRLREQNPQLPAVLFMNEEEKELFLEEVNA